jgi:sigma-B regulation protein RsbU (phosphoserine phosphatase)
MMDKEQHITLPNDVATVPRLAEFIDQVCEAAGIDMATTMQINLAVEEAVVNVMNYAYPPGTMGTVEVSADTSDDKLTLVIEDNGTPFDPTAKDDADTTLGAEERPIGGLGIHLVRQLMDSISYKRSDDGRNILTIAKKWKV